ncbi:nitrile hydratase accessory protein [Piscicoccus intestinalis]|uniref:nitrile hydratase accessory protein n=1 Tax=Piscicoccus intestinalis TaxID=746033 RepID=UPI0008383D08|nr:nitrile hydratase accessory protein [Piscicoccus intestinalis]
MIPAPTLAQVLAANPGLPAPPDGRTGFAEPWQATVFAMTVHLADRGVFTWAQWAAALGNRLRSQPTTDPTGPTGNGPTVDDATRYDAAGYFEAWEAALSDLLTELGLVEPGVIDRTERAWHAAAARTPHGRPIELPPDPPSGA